MPQVRGDHINPPPLAPPHHVPRALELAHPVFACVLNHLRSLHREDAIVKGIMGSGKMPLLLDWCDDLHHHLGALLIRDAMLEVLE